MVGALLLMDLERSRKASVKADKTVVEFSFLVIFLGVTIGELTDDSEGEEGIDGRGTLLQVSFCETPEARFRILEVTESELEEEEDTDSTLGVLEKLGDPGAELGAELDDSNRQFCSGLFTDSFGRAGIEDNS